MKITINDVVTEVEKGASVADIIALQGLEGKGGVAVAVNGKIVRKDDWATYSLHDLDSLLIINAAYGG